jgi:hypothetical protein
MPVRMGLKRIPNYLYISKAKRWDYRNNTHQVIFTHKLWEERHPLNGGLPVLPLTVCP